MKKSTIIIVLCIFLISIVAVAALPINLIPKEKKDNKDDGKDKNSKDKFVITLTNYNGSNNNSSNNSITHNTSSASQNINSSQETTGPIRITRAVISGNAYTGENFNVIIEAFDPDDSVTVISLGRDPYGVGNWQAQSCNENRCQRTWALSEIAPGIYNYRIMAKNIRNQTISSAITVSIIDRSQVSNFIFRTAAMESRDYQSRGVTNYINGVNISIRNTAGIVSVLGQPFATFSVAPNQVLAVNYTKMGYINDEDYFYIDQGLQNCNGASCSYNGNGYSTSCSFVPADSNYLCELRNTHTNYYVNFIYSRSDPVIGNFVVRYINPLYVSSSPIVNFKSIDKFAFDEDSNSLLDLSPYVYYGGDLRSIVWSSYGNNHLHITFNGNIASITPEHNWIGRENVLFIATSPDGISSSDRLIIEVRNVDNDPPIFVSKNPEDIISNVVIGSSKVFSARVVDPEYHPLSFTWLLNNVTISSGSSAAFVYHSVREGLDTLTLKSSDGTNEISTEWKINSFYSTERNAPVVSNFNIDPLIQDQDGIIIISADVIDDSKLQSVISRVTLPDNTHEDIVMDNIGDKHSASFSSTSQKRNYTVQLITKDIFNNVNDLSRGTFLIKESNKPVISNVVINPNPQDILIPINISAVVTDDSLISEVKAIIKKPDGVVLQSNMFTSGIPNVYSVVYADTMQLGNYTVEIKAIDEFGSIQSSFSNFTVSILDMEPPQVRILAPSNNLVIRDNVLEAIYLAIDARTSVVYCGYQLDNSVITEIVGCSNLRLTNLSAGEHILRVFARDEMNNEGVDSVVFNINLNSTINGVIRRNSDLQPIQGALVKVYNGEILVNSARTASDGTYYVEVESGTYSINVSKDFADRTFYKNNSLGNVHLVQNGNRNIDLSLNDISWWNSSWNYMKTMNVENPTNEILNNFKFVANSIYGNLVGLDTVSLISAGKLRSDCKDLKFVDDQYNELAYEIDSGSSGCNTTNTIVWVKKTLNPGNNTLNTYYGNPQYTLGSIENPWANDYVLVWHLSDIGSVALDSAGNVNGSIVGSVSGANGVIGNGLRFANAIRSDSDRIEARVPDLQNQENGTISFWVKLSDKDSEQWLSDIQFTENSSNSLFFRAALNHFANDFNNDPRLMMTSNDPFLSGQWYYISLTWDNNGRKFFVNGIENANDSSNNIFASQIVPHLWIGDGEPSRRFGSGLQQGIKDGVIDEFEIDRTTRDSSWLIRSMEQEKSFLNEEISL